MRFNLTAAQLFEHLVESQRTAVASAELAGEIDLLLDYWVDKVPARVLQNARNYALQRALVMDLTSVRPDPGCYYMTPHVALNAEVLQGISICREE